MIALNLLKQASLHMFQELEISLDRQFLFQAILKVKKMGLNLASLYPENKTKIGRLLMLGDRDVMVQK